MPAGSATIGSCDSSSGQTKPGWPGLYATAEIIASTTAGRRAVVELLAHLDDKEEETHWPIAVVAEAPDDRSVLFRTYCSQWPVDGRRHVRPPILEPADEHPDGVVGRYLAALSAGDVEVIVHTFTEAGCLREAIGPHASHQGAQALALVLFRMLQRRRRNRARVLSRHR